MAKLTGKVAVIASRSSGIRLATAQRLVNEGAYGFIPGPRNVGGMKQAMIATAPEHFDTFFNIHAVPVTRREPLQDGH